MTKISYGSYVICTLLALLQLVMFFSAYSRGDMAIYHGVIVVASGGTSLALLASILFPLKARLIALLVFAVATISVYVWSISIWPANFYTMSFSDGIIQGLLFLIFVFAPILGLVSGAYLLRQHAKRQE